LAGIERKKQKLKLIMKEKAAFGVGTLNNCNPEEIAAYTDYIQALRFEEKLNISIYARSPGRYTFGITLFFDWTAEKSLELQLPLE
jgi:hypothetical protein